MAKVTLTLTDDETEEDGVLFRVEFDPPLTAETVLSAAQSEAALILEIMQRRASGESLHEIADAVDDDEYGRIAGEYEPRGINLATCANHGLEECPDCGTYAIVGEPTEEGEN